MKRNFYGRMFSGVVLASTVALSACADMRTQPLTCPKYDRARDVDIKISFVDGCPVSVDCDLPEVSRFRRVIWQGSDSNGTTPRYEIFFDPFKGGPLKTITPDGKVRSPGFDVNAPAVEYKYTIVGDTCKDKPLDPRFRLR